MPINRRTFLASGFAATGALALSQQDRSKPPPRPPLLTMSYNILACRGFPTNSVTKPFLQRARRTMTRRFAIELGLYWPDVITFQESPRQTMVAEIAKYMDYKYAYFKSYFGGTVMTRHEIVSHKNCPLVKGPRPKALFTRHWGRAVLRVDGEDIVLYSAHLHPSKTDVRAAEVTAMLAVMKQELGQGRSLLFQGDLNHTPDGPEYARWTDAGWIDTFARKGEGKGLTIPSTKPIKRIDYVFAHGPIAERLQSFQVLFEGPFRTNPDDRRSFALSDHIPVVARFSRPKPR